MPKQICSVHSADVSRAIKLFGLHDPVCYAEPRASQKIIAVIRGSNNVSNDGNGDADIYERIVCNCQNCLVCRYFKSPYIDKLDIS